MKRFKLSSKLDNVATNLLLYIFLSTCLFIASLLLLLVWNGINYCFDFNLSIRYSILGYVYLGCWIVVLILAFIIFKSDSKSKRGNKLWDHEMDRRYIGDMVGDDYFDTGDPYGD